MPEGGIRDEFILNVKGQHFVRFAGVLDAATQAGLKSLTATIVQIPAPENGYLAVVTATAEFADGRSFTDVGDCSPASTSAAMAVHSLRMAATRAEGRAMGRALNISVALIEELAHDDEPLGRGQPSHGAAGNGQAAARPPQSAPQAAAGAAPRPAGGTGDGTVACEEPGCGVLLTKNQVTMSQHHARRSLCPAHLKPLQEASPG